MQKLLIDENLSPSLIGQAVAKGFVCSHINYLDLTGLKDWELKATILDGDWTFITSIVTNRSAARCAGRIATIWTPSIPPRISKRL